MESISNMEESRTVQETLSRLRSLAGPQGVDVDPRFGWFGFLDAGAEVPSAVASTPSTALSDSVSEPSFSAPGHRGRWQARRLQYRHRDARYNRWRAVQIKNGDERKVKAVIRRYIRKYGRGTVWHWLQRLLSSLS